MRTMRVAAAVVGLVSAGPCLGVVQVFVNSAGTFVWNRELPGFFQGRGLDITQDPAQLNPSIDRTIWALASFHGSSGMVAASQISATSFYNPGGLARIARSTTPTTYIEQNGQPAQVFAIAHFATGDSVGANQDWQLSPTYQLGSFISGPQLPQGRSFIGVQFPMADGTHYGFVEMTFPDAAPTVFSWGYETQPDTPVVIPSPAGLAVIGAGLASLRRRR